jgi:hypothetical protein
VGQVELFLRHLAPLASGDHPCGSCPNVQTNISHQSAIGRKHSFLPKIYGPHKLELGSQNLVWPLFSQTNDNSSKNVRFCGFPAPRPPDETPAPWDLKTRPTASVRSF